MMFSQSLDEDLNTNPVLLFQIVSRSRSIGGRAGNQIGSSARRARQIAGRMSKEREDNMTLNNRRNYCREEENMGGERRGEEAESDVDQWWTIESVSSPSNTMRVGNWIESLTGKAGLCD